MVHMQDQGTINSMIWMQGPVLLTASALGSALTVVELQKMDVRARWQQPPLNEV